MADNVSPMQFMGVYIFFYKVCLLFVDIEQSAFLEIFRNQDQLLPIPVIANRISLIWIRFFNKHYGKEDFDH